MSEEIKSCYRIRLKRGPAIKIIKTPATMKTLEIKNIEGKVIARRDVKDTDEVSERFDHALISPPELDGALVPRGYWWTPEEAEFYVKELVKRGAKFQACYLENRLDGYLKEPISEELYGRTPVKQEEPEKVEVEGVKASNENAGKGKAIQMNNDMPPVEKNVEPKKKPGRPSKNK